MNPSIARSSNKWPLVLGLFLIPAGLSRQAAPRTVERPGSGLRPGLDVAKVAAQAASLAVPFVANTGRFPTEVRFSADLFSGRFFLTQKDLVYSLAKPLSKRGVQAGKPGPRTKPGKMIPVRSLVFREYFVGQDGAPIGFIPVADEPAPTEVSYFRGKNPAAWKSSLASHYGLLLGEIFPCIDVKLKASGGNVEKVFIVNPGGDAAGIRMEVEGVKGLNIDEEGRLLLQNDMGELAMRAPKAWQEIGGLRREVKAKYRLFGKNGYGLVLEGGYDKSLPLIIDPALDTILASTFFGGSHFDFSNSMALDREGNVYLTGSTSSPDFPMTRGAYDPSYNGGVEYSPYDVFVAKLNGDLTRLLAATYLGGGSYDSGASLALDGAGNVYLAGTTGSPDFPTASDAFDRTYNGGSQYYPLDAFVSKLDHNLKQLLGSTYLGGGDTDRGNSLALDHAGNVIVTGWTASDDFPTTAGAFDPTFNEGNVSYFRYDAFVSKLNGDLTRMLASTFLGGSMSEAGNFLLVDRSGNLYLTGPTNSTDFPITPGAYDRTLNGGNGYYHGDAFVSKLDGDLSALLASTYLGGEDDETGASLAFGSWGGVYVAGSTYSVDFPTTSGSFEPKFSGYEGDSCEAFISKLKNDLSELQASTFFSIPGQDSSYCEAIALDGSNNVYATGCVEVYCGFHFYDDYYNGLAFFSKLDGKLTKLLGEKHIGDESCDDFDVYCYGTSLALNAVGNAYFTGRTDQQAFPTTEGAFDRAFKSIFVSKLNGSSIEVTLISPGGGESWVAGSAHDILWTSSGKIDDVLVEFSADNGSSWTDVAVSPARDGHFPWTVPRVASRQCLVRVSDAANPGIRDTCGSPFSIVMGIDLAAERCEARALSITRPYGEIEFLAALEALETAVFSAKPVASARDPRSLRRSTLPRLYEESPSARAPDVAISAYRILRSMDGGEFVVVKTIAPAELNGGRYRWQDKYLEEESAYTYRVEAVDADGQLVGISPEKSI